MFSEIRGQNLFGATATLWVLFTAATFLGSASGVPQQLFGNELSRRADAPGLGVELELGGVVIKTDKTLTDADRESIKGAELIPENLPDSIKSMTKTNWKLTAEIGNTIFPEAIVDGVKNKLGDKKSKKIGEEIAKFFTDWAPCRDKGCTVKIAGHDNLGPWKVHWPDKLPLDLSTVEFGSQVTTAMPLEAILTILGDSKNKNLKKNPLASKGAMYAKDIKILTKDDFSTFTKIKKSDITEEFLGFFSFLTSYCILAPDSTPKEGPKRILPIMPRTDFVTQYTLFIEPKLKEQLTGGETTLVDIVGKVSGKGDTLANNKFKWKNVVTTQISDQWADKDKDIKDGTLDVGKFLSYLQGYDKKTKKELPKMDLLKLMDKTLRHGQIGGLGSKMETIQGKTKEVPIFEFRELDGSNAPSLGKTMESYEKKILEYHNKYKKRSIDVQEEADMLQEE